MDSNQAALCEQMFKKLGVDPYKMLGLRSGKCTWADVRRKYKEKAREWHPDKGKQRNDKKFKLLNTCYAYLSSQMAESDQAAGEPPAPRHGLYVVEDDDDDFQPTAPDTVVPSNAESELGCSGVICDGTQMVISTRASDVPNWCVKLRDLARTKAIEQGGDPPLEKHLRSRALTSQEARARIAALKRDEARAPQAVGFAVACERMRTQREQELAAQAAEARKYFERHAPSDAFLSQRALDL
jgi:hypothetical protein